MNPDILLKIPNYRKNNNKNSEILNTFTFFPLIKYITPYNYQRFSTNSLNIGTEIDRGGKKMKELKSNFEKKKVYKEEKLGKIFKNYPKPTSRENKNIIQKVRKWVKQINKGQIEPFDKSVMKTKSFKNPYLLERTCCEFQLYQYSSNFKKTIFNPRKFGDKYNSHQIISWFQNNLTQSQERHKNISVKHYKRVMRS